MTLHPLTPALAAELLPTADEDFANILRAISDQPELADWVFRVFVDDVWVGEVGARCIPVGGDVIAAVSVHQASRRRGYGTEALQRFCEHAFTSGVTRVFATPKTHAAYQTFTRAGFHPHPNGWWVRVR